MPIPGVLAGAVAKGVVGAVVYDVTKIVLGKVSTREAAVRVTALGLKGTRRAEELAENVRLNAADIVAEAKARIGEESAPPTVGAPHDHDH
jgi:hypothetical protein